MSGTPGTASGGPYREPPAEATPFKWYEKYAPSEDEKRAWVQMWAATKMASYDSEASARIADKGMEEYRKRFGLPK